MPRYSIGTGVTMKNVVSVLWGAFLCGLALVGYQTPSHAQNAIQALVTATCGTPGITLTAGKNGPVFQDNTGKLCVNAAVTATVSVTGFQPGGAFATLTATGSSASVALPAGTVVAFQNTGTTTVSCTLGIGSATASASQNIIPAGSTLFLTVGSNTFGACIDQTGSTSNVVALSGGAGLGTGFGGGSSGGGGGGAVTLASGAVAAGAYSAGAFVSGSILSGALASGAVVDLTNLSTPVAANTATATKGMLLGGQFDTTQKTLTNGQQAALSVSPRGAMFVAVGADGFAVTQPTATSLNAAVVGTGTAGSPAGNILTVQGVASMTPILATITGSLSANQSVNVNQWAGSTLGAPSTYGTSPGAVAVNGVNAFVTNTNANGQATAANSSPVVLPAAQVTADPCTLGTKTNFTIATSSGTVQLVAPSGSTQVYICSLFTIGATASIQNIVGGTGATCTTGTPVAVAGSTTAASGMSFAANGGFTFGNGGGTVLRTTTAGHGVCLIQSATAAIAGGGTFVQQ